MKIELIVCYLILLLLLIPKAAYPKSNQVVFCGSVENDLHVLLTKEGFNVKRYNSPAVAIQEAPRGAAVFITSDSYPVVAMDNLISQEMLNSARRKKLKLYVEYPASFPGLEINSEPVETRLERGVITSNVFGEQMFMSLLGIHNCHILETNVEDPLIVLAKVVGFDKAEYGLADTKTYPLLFEKSNVLLSMTKLSNFATARYGPSKSIKQVWTYILSQMTDDKSYNISYWPDDVVPMYSENEALPKDARLNSVKKGVEWFYNGRFFVHPNWKDHWLKHQGDGVTPFGPPISQDLPNGDGTFGILEGHASIINYDGSQQYRYWMRADVQGEASMALAAAGNAFNNKDYNEKAINLIDFVFEKSNLRADAKNDKNSAAYGLIGWATTHPGVFYGDDNARAILGIIGASAYLKTDKWDKELVEAIMANFRTTGKYGFRGERLEEEDILRNGWKYYWERELFHPSPHFESWMWACYLWLYDKTGYEPLFTRTKKAIRMMMEAYPDKWLWGSSLRTTRMILPLAWLVRTEDTAEHRQWLDIIVADVLKNQVEAGAIKEELGVPGKGRFKTLNSNEDYGTDEGSLIFKNGEQVADILYSCNFAVFCLNEAAHATGNKRYKAAVVKLSDFLTRIQVKSETHKDLDGAWFRGFDYGRWEYWGSNSDWGWGAWCTLTGWIQSWIVATQLQIEEKESFWNLTLKSDINEHMEQSVKVMFGSETQ